MFFLNEFMPKKQPSFEHVRLIRVTLRSLIV